MNDNTNPIAPPNVPPVTPMPQSIPAAPVAPATPQVPMPADAATPPPPPQKLTMPKFDFKELPQKIKTMPRKFKIIAGVFIFMLILLIIGGLLGGPRRVKQLILPSPSPIPATTPVGEVTTPSVYATDAEVLDIEKKLGEFDQSLGRTDLHEDTLRVPNLDWDINFKK